MMYIIVWIEGNDYILSDWKKYNLPKNWVYDENRQVWTANNGPFELEFVDHAQDPYEKIVKPKGK